MRTTTKQDLIDRVAQMTEQRRYDVKRTISTFLDVIVEELASGSRIEFREFGVFENRGRKGRTAQNPRTGETVDVPPRRTVKFKVSRQVRDRLEAAGAPPAEMVGKSAPPARIPQTRARQGGGEVALEVKSSPKRAVRATVG